jgi:ectoine hydroxylase-related dioxygenase (phytanoyl-CoA dioxygenase family)
MLSASEIEDFKTKGYLTRLALSTSEAMQVQREQILGIVSAPRDCGVPGATYYAQHYHDHYHDRHLDSAAILEFACHPAIVSAAASVLGPDLVLWRTSFFVQSREDPTTQWHQDRQFSGPSRRPSLVCFEHASEQYDEDNMRGFFPRVPNAVSAWVALESASRESGCLMMVEGSNTEGVIPVRKALPTDKQIFGKGTVLDYEIPDDRVRYLELDAGQFLLFDRLTLHASVPNTLERARVGLSMRFTTPEMLVYPGYERDGHEYPLARYRAILVQGEDRFRRNDAWMETLADRRAALTSA